MPREVQAKHKLASTTKFYLDKLGELQGGVIDGVTFDPTDSGWDGWDTQFFGLIVKLPNDKRKVVWFLRDDEGNGPGSFEIADIG